MILRTLIVAIKIVLLQCGYNHHSAERKGCLSIVNHIDISITIGRMEGYEGLSDGLEGKSNKLP